VGLPKIPGLSGLGRGSKMCPDLRRDNGMEPKSALNSAIDTMTIARSVQDRLDQDRSTQNGPALGGPVVLKDLPLGSNVNPKAACIASGAGDGGNGLILARPGDPRALDASLAQLAFSALGRHPLIPVGKVRPVVRNTWLILEGEVETRVQRQAAEDAAKGLPGIRGISNNILIASEVMAQRVGRKIDEAFIRNARLSASRISVTASNQKIILSGSVRSRVEREEAEAAAWTVDGVAHVVNRIRALA
jgi:osmotically-inducible protein OsmY